MPPEKEFDSLRSEILQLSSRQLNLVTFTLTVSVTLIGIGLSNNNGFMVLTPLLLLAFLLNQQVISRRGILRLSTYISYFHETRLNGIGWETYVNQLRKLSAEKPLFLDFGSTQKAFAYLPIVTGIICILASWYLLKSETLRWILPSAALLAWTWHSWWILRRLKLAESDELRQEYMKAWAEAESDLQQRNVPSA